jgi:hypothetical protein
LNKGVRGWDGGENVWTKRGEVNETRNDGTTKNFTTTAPPQILLVFSN